ncbi:hypothetical protein [Hymenobacter crusticola]|uniref:DUF4136 domain-containing protein n=1 Tax=Hymenobacter crusticola TaxID=1770526 RepID=A0A243WFP8_9BACT|nr:hypothetical protein [Hymenobacter crusticola]OUJ74289.1 hypothetical protein BXP70_11260 [Hymenobacter crusticola]
MKLMRTVFSAGLFAVVINLLLAGTAWAQRTSSSFVQQFAGGTVLLANGDTIEGPLALHRNEDVILVSMPNNTVSTLSAVAVQSFAVKGERLDRNRNQFDDFYDARMGYYYGSPIYGYTPRARRTTPDTSLVRVFRVFRWNHDNDYSDFKSPAFFEQLSSGPTLLLRRESLVQRPVSYGSPYGFGGYGAYGYPYGVPRTMGYYTEIKDNFYLGTPSGTIISLRNPKKDLLAAFRQQAKQIEKYAKENQLDYTNARELAFIVNYANSLQSQPRQ